MTWQQKAWRSLRWLRSWRYGRLHTICYHLSPGLRLPCLRYPTYDYRCPKHQDDNALS